MDRFDLLFIAGLVLVAIGAGLAWLPAGLIAGGAGLIVLALLGARGVDISGAEEGAGKDGRS